MDNNTARVNLYKIICDWCEADTLAPWQVKIDNWVYYACTDHAHHWFPHIMEGR